MAQHDLELMDGTRTGGTLDGSGKPILDAFRRWGHLQAGLDPLGFFAPQPNPELDHDGEEAADARRWYAGAIGVEFMHIADPERRRWVQERMEQPIPAVDAGRTLDRLLRAELFEEVLHGRYRARSASPWKGSRR